VRNTWRDRLTDPWYVLPLCALAGAVLALSLAIVLEPNNSISNSTSVAAGVTPAATPTPDAAAPAGDVARGADAYKIAAAAFSYYRDHRAFPFTAGGGIEPLCADATTDAGCKFSAYVNPVPVDPRGTPGVNGYWYQSDGLGATLYMSLESGESLGGSPCLEQRPPQLAQVAHLYCLKIGPPKE
jgi:hypothetical protein